jgi:hypothetical protein
MEPMHLACPLVGFVAAGGPGFRYALEMAVYPGRFSLSAGERVGAIAYCMVWCLSLACLVAIGLRG